MAGFIYIWIECDEQKACSYQDYFIEKLYPVSRQDDEEGFAELWNGGVSYIAKLPQAQHEIALGVLKYFSEHACADLIVFFYGESNKDTVLKHIIQKGQAKSSKIKKTTFTSKHLITAYSNFVD